MRILVILLLMTMVACTKYTGLENFHTVEEGLVYRGAQTDGVGYAALKKLGVRTVLKLNSELAEDERRWAEMYNIHLIEVPISGIFAPSEAQEQMIQAVLRSRALQPVYVHCTHGKDRTGLAAAIYRVEVQHMGKEEAHAEWMRYGHSPLLFLMDNFYWNHVR